MELTLTNELRWLHGNLQQKWIDVKEGTHVWKDVPVESING